MTHFKDWNFAEATRPLLEQGADIFIRFNEGLSILKKVVAVESGKGETGKIAVPRRFDELVSASRPFGLRTFFEGKNARSGEDVLVYQNGGVGFVARDSLTVGRPLIDTWKVFVGAAAPGTGNKDTYPHRVLSTPFIGEPGSICTETYVCIGPLRSNREAQSVCSYLACRLTRLLVLLHKPTQHTTRKVYAFVPMQNWSVTWTDEALYRKYGLTKSEIAFVERIVRPMDLSARDAEILGSDDDE